MLDSFNKAEAIVPLSFHVFGVGVILAIDFMYISIDSRTLPNEVHTCVYMG